MLEVDELQILLPPPTKCWIINKHQHSRLTLCATLKYIVEFYMHHIAYITIFYHISYISIFHHIAYSTIVVSPNMFEIYVNLF